MRIKIKFCGMQAQEDLAEAIKLGVDALGFIFYPSSPRAISIERAKILLKDLPPFISKVAVMVNPSAKDVKELLNNLPIDCLQFHGNEEPKFCESFSKPYIKAVQATSTLVIEKAMQNYKSAAAILVDTPSEKHGGTGESFDWSRIPEKREKPLILAGGLNCQSAALTIQSLRPYAVDLCSGIEASPGVKDKIAMQNFVKLIRGVENDY